MNDVCKAIILSVSIMCATFIVALVLYFQNRPDYAVTGINNSFAHCLSVVMSESRQSGKVIDAEQAKDICVHAKHKVNFDYQE